jgi:multiple sugar transport system permease protein
VSTMAPARPDRAVRSQREMRRQLGRKNRNGLAYVLLVLGALVMVFPFLYQLIMSFSTYEEITSTPPTLLPESLQLSNWTTALTSFPIGNQMLVSTVVTVARVAAHVLFCSLAGYAFARMHFRGRGVLFAILLSILMVPTQVYLLPQYTILQNLGLLDTLRGLALPGLFSAFGTFLMVQAFSGLPKELEEAARLDGAGPARIFFTVMLPLVGPSISALVVTSTLASWNDLLWPLVVMSTQEKMPLSVGLANLQGLHFTDYGPLMAASLMAMAPILILFIILQKRVIGGLANAGIKG